MNTLFVIDIDATIADATERIKKAGPEPSRENREEYLKWLEVIQSEESLLSDKPVKGMRSLINALYTSPYMDIIEIVYLTSREEKWRSITEKWLGINKFYRLDLEMRPDGCWDEGHVFKHRVISQLAKNYSSVVVIDDDEHGKLEEVCKTEGWTFLKARSGGQV